MKLSQDSWQIGLEFPLLKVTGHRSLVDGLLEDEFDVALVTAEGSGTERAGCLECMRAMGEGYLGPVPGGVGGGGGGAGRCEEKSWRMRVNTSIVINTSG